MRPLRFWPNPEFSLRLIRPDQMMFFEPARSNPSHSNKTWVARNCKERKHVWSTRNQSCIDVLQQLRASGCYIMFLWKQFDDVIQKWTELWKCKISNYGNDILGSCWSCSHKIAGLAVFVLQKQSEIWPCCKRCEEILTGVSRSH